MYRVRRKDQSVYFWINPLCINQNDLEEKTRQTAMIRDIYQKAYRVRVWLGEATPDSAFAVDFISKILSPGFMDDECQAWLGNCGVVRLGRLLESC
jgi:hypothetical protein